MRTLMYYSLHDSITNIELPIDSVVLGISFDDSLDTAIKLHIAISDNKETKMRKFFIKNHMDEINLSKNKFLGFVTFHFKKINSKTVYVFEELK